MTFHRLSTPSYYGGLLAGYDYINDPVANGDAGVASPTDTGKLAIVGHPNYGTYFVGFAADAKAWEANRGLHALSENTDALDDLFHADVAVLTHVDKAGVVAASVVITPAADLAGLPIFVGPPGTANTQAGLEAYFRITDQNNNDLVTGNPTNTQIVVTSVSPGGAVGTFYSAALTLNLNTIPPVSDIRVHCGVRSSLAQMKPDALVQSGIQSRKEAQAALLQFKNDLVKAADNTKGAVLVGVVTGDFTTDVLTGSTGGGIGTAVTTVKDALNAIDARLVARRAFTAVWTDSINSIGGDYNSDDIDFAVDGSLGGGMFMLRRGNYVISTTPTSWTENVRMVGEGTSTYPEVRLAAGRALDLFIRGKLEFENLKLVSDELTKQVKFTPSGSPAEFTWRNGYLQSGIFAYAGGTEANVFELDNIKLLASAGAAANIGYEHTQDGIAVYRKCTFDQKSGAAPTAVFKLHDVTGASVSALRFEECTFESDTTGVDAFLADTCTIPALFVNCRFSMTDTTAGAGHAANLQSSKNIVMINCTFEALNGRCFNAEDVGALLINPVFITGTTPGAGTNPQMIVGYGYDDGAGDEQALKIVNGTAYYGSGVSKGTGGDSPTLPFIELGGIALAAQTGRVEVDGLHISPVGTPEVHNFSAVELNPYAGNRDTRNIYKNVTYDAADLSAGNAGVLDGHYDAYPALVEVGGAGGLSRSQTLVDNLVITGVANPSANHARRILVAKRITAGKIVVEGSSAIIAHAFTTAPVVELDESDVDTIYLSRQHGIACSGPAQLKLTNGSRVNHGEYRGNGLTQDPGTAWIYLAGHFNELRDFHAFWDAGSVATAVPVLLSSGNFDAMQGNYFVCQGDPGIDIIVQVTGEGSSFAGNMVRWSRGAATMFSSTGARCAVVGNRFLNTTGAGVPTFAVSGTDSVDSANVAGANAAVTQPS